MLLSVITREEIGARLRGEREKLGLSQSEMGEKGGVSRISQAAYEGARRPPDIDYLIGLNGAGIDIGFLVTGARAIDNLTADEVALLDSFRLLAELDRLALMQIANTMTGRSAASHRIHTPAPEYHSEDPRR